LDPLVEQSKKNSEAGVKRRDTDAAVRLLNAAIIDEKTPVFWSLVIARVTAVCGEFREELPNDFRYHLSPVPQLNGFFLHGGGRLPRCILSAQLNLIARRVDLSERILYAREDDPIPQLVSPVAITVGEKEELIFRFQNGSFDTPDDLARALIKYVLKFSNL
jgi:hypothetical protein